MKWGELEKKDWRRSQCIQRSYANEVVSQIQALEGPFTVVQYGALTLTPVLYPLFLLRTSRFDPAKKTVLITGGVHGYETSGVHGALRFLQCLQSGADRYRDHFNFVCAPCISPWAFETINRWNPDAIDPNRSFYENSPSEECRLFIEALSAGQFAPFVHFDLHETTDTDNSVFRPALEQRDGVTHEFSEIPDGFYLVGDTGNPQKDFQKSIVDTVRRVTHIAPADGGGKIIGVEIEQEGVINYDVKKLFLCTGVSQASFATTTEVYPDSPRVTAEICIQAQVAAIRGGLDYLIELQSRKTSS